MRLMINLNTLVAPPRSLSEIARARFLASERRPLFLCEWPRVLFINYEVEPAILQPQVPFELELFDGKAIVSLAAFTMRRFRPNRGGLLGAWTFLPAARNSFLNVRAYVRHHDEPGVYFMTQWLSHPFCLLGRLPMLRLPWHLGRMRYDFRHESGRLSGHLSGARGRSLAIAATLPLNPQFTPADPNSVAEFAMERYAAFALCGGQEVVFRVWHKPWPQCAVEVEVQDAGLLAQSGDWYGQARFAGASYTIGCNEVWMGRVRAIAASRRA